MDIIYSVNLNNRLECNSYVDIRPFNNSKYFVGQPYQVHFKNKHFNSIIVSISNFYVKDLNAYMAYLYSGYNITGCTNILRKMYPHMNFNTDKFSFILFKKDKQ